MLLRTDRLTSVVEAMDEQFLLLNGTYRDRVRALREAYDALPRRTANLAGKGYPADEAGHRTFIERMVKQDRAAAGPDHVKAIIAPHIDYGRGADVYRRAYASLPGEITPSS